MYPLIETKRLILRALTLDDDAFILKLRSHPDIIKYVDMKPYQDIERARRFITALTKDIEAGEALFWGILEKASGNLVGTVCLWNFEKIDSDAPHAELKAELGYEVHPDAQSKGFAGEAVSALLDYADSGSPIAIVDAITHKDNIPSRKLLERHAFALLGVAVEVDPELEESTDMLLYRLDLKGWRNHE